MAAPSFKFDIQGLREVQRKLKRLDDELLQAAYRDMLEQAAQAAKADIAAGAPSRSGQLKAKLTHRLQKSPIPRWAVVKTTATRTSKKYRRYSYPKRLEFDPRSRHKDWMLKGLKRSQGKVNAILAAFGRKIERFWGAR